jgi:malic enzyme
LTSDTLEARASIVATGRSDFAYQVDNAVVFPAFCSKGSIYAIGFVLTKIG